MFVGEEASPGCQKTVRNVWVRLMNKAMSALSVQESCVTGARSKSSLISRNVTVSGRRTSVRLEQEMWNALRDIARREKCTIHDICSLVDLRRSVSTSLTAAIRVFLMLYYRAAATEEGHRRAGHGSFETMRQRARLRDGGTPSVPVLVRSTPSVSGVG